MDESTDANLNGDCLGHDNSFGSEEDLSDKEDAEKLSSTRLKEDGDDDDADAEFEALLAAQNRFLQNNVANQSTDSGTPRTEPKELSFDSVNLERKQPSKKGGQYFQNVHKGCAFEQTSSTVLPQLSVGSFDISSPLRVRNAVALRSDRRALKGASTVLVDESPVAVGNFPAKRLSRSSKSLVKQATPAADGGPNFVFEVPKLSSYVVRSNSQARLSNSPSSFSRRLASLDTPCSPLGGGKVATRSSPILADFQEEAHKQVSSTFRAATLRVPKESPRSTSNTPDRTPGVLLSASKKVVEIINRGQVANGEKPIQSLGQLGRLPGFGYPTEPERRLGRPDKMELERQRRARLHNSRHSKKPQGVLRSLIETSQPGASSMDF